jgi:chaperonin cofactor prefoldin
MNPDEPQTPEPLNLPPRNPPDRDSSARGSTGNSEPSITPLPNLQSSIPPSGSPPNPPISLSGSISARSEDDLVRRIAELQQQEKALRQEIASLQNSYNAMLQKQVTEAQMAVGRLVKEGTSELEQRRQTLQLAIEQLERRQERIKNEMRTTFAGASQDLAIRVQGFKDYLVGSLQDLVTAAEQLQFTPEEPKRTPRPDVVPEIVREAREPERDIRREPVKEPTASDAESPRFAEQGFQERAKRIRSLLDQYRSSPDYYGPPWQLRRTFEPIHAERVSNWFFTQGGRGAIRTMGSRLQNILIASAVISVLNDLYGERLRPLILGNSPERLGEWRRGLQDCLGVSRADFGIDEGIVLFEAPEPLAQRADRLVKQRQLPLIIIDETEEFVSVALLQFPLWLAFAPDPTAPSPVMY